MKKTLLAIGAFALLFSAASPAGRYLDQFRTPISSIAGATAGRVPYDNGTYGAWSAQPSTGQVLQGASTGSPTWANIASILTAGTGITLTGTTNATIATKSAASAIQGTLELNTDLGGTATAPNVVGIQGDAVAAPSVASTYLQWSGSALGWVAGTLPAGVSSPGTGQLAFAPTSTSATVLGGTMPASFAGNFVNLIDSSGNPNYSALQLSGGQTIAQLLSRGATGVGSAIRLGNNAYAANAAIIGAYAAGTFASGSWVTTGQITLSAAQAHGVSALGTNMLLGVVPNGSTSITNYVALMQNGSLVTNDTGVAIATTATGGFVYIGGGAGAPTGTPTSYTGATPLYYDTTNLVMWAWNGTAWSPMNGTPVAVANTIAGLAITYPTDIFVSYTGASPLTFPSAATFKGCTIVVKYTIKNATATATISASSGNVEGASTYTLSALLASYVHATFCSDGTNWWICG